MNSTKVGGALRYFYQRRGFLLALWVWFQDDGIKSKKRYQWVAGSLWVVLVCRRVQDWSEVQRRARAKVTKNGSSRPTMRGCQTSHNPRLARSRSWGQYQYVHETSSRSQDLRVVVVVVEFNKFISLLFSFIICLFVFGFCAVESTSHSSVFSARSHIIFYRIVL